MEAVKQWADMTTCHGVRDVNQSSSICGKISWSFVVVVFLTLMGLQLFDIQRRFSQHQWVTTVIEENTGGDRIFLNFAFNVHFLWYR